jgi:hypothetical protein
LTAAQDTTRTSGEDEKSRDETTEPVETSVAEGRFAAVWRQKQKVRQQQQILQQELPLKER